jgi:hypothetical protein
VRNFDACFILDTLFASVHFEFLIKFLCHFVPHLALFIFLFVAFPRFLLESDSSENLTGNRIVQFVGCFVFLDFSVT